MSDEMSLSVQLSIPVHSLLLLLMDFPATVADSIRLLQVELERDLDAIVGLHSLKEEVSFGYITGSVWSFILFISRAN